MADLAQDRIVRKEVALGAVREIEPPKNHIGLGIAPMKDVQSDDVIFSYIAPDTDGLAPARAEDAESELAEKDDTVGTGRASIVDWAIKDHYDASDVSRYREFKQLAELAAGGGAFPLTVGSMTEDFAGKVAADTRRRRRKLDNRIEWLIMSALSTGKIDYTSSKVQFSVDFVRPADQQAQAPAGGLWSLNTSDPIGDFIQIDDFMFDTHGVRLGRAIASRKAIYALLNSDRWAARSGLTGATGGVPVDPRYVIDGYGIDSVKAVFERQTGCQLIEYDSVYRTRAMGSKNVVNNRFLPENRIVFLPREADLDEVAGESEIGFAKTLTSPHPEGNWTPSFYEWERSTVDPWGQDMGTGIKAFPVFPHMEYTFTLDVLA